MLLLTYQEQLKMLASEERVDLLDAVRHAGLDPKIYKRSIAGTMQLRFDKAHRIAEAIRDMSAR